MVFLQATHFRYPWSHTSERWVGSKEGGIEQTQTALQISKSLVQASILPNSHFIGEIWDTWPLCSQKGVWKI